MKKRVQQKQKTKKIFEIKELKKRNRAQQTASCHCC